MHIHVHQYVCYSVELGSGSLLLAAMPSRLVYIVCVRVIYVCSKVYIFIGDFALFYVHLMIILAL